MLKTVHLFPEDAVHNIFSSPHTLSTVALSELPFQGGLIP